MMKIVIRESKNEIIELENNKRYKYFIIINNNSFTSNFDKINLLNQILKSIKLKNKELWLKRDIIKENKEKIKNLSWLKRMNWKSIFLR